MFSKEVAQYFQPVFDLILMLLSVIAATKWKRRGANGIINGNKTSMYPLIFCCVALCIIVGFRPLSGKLFGDTVNYARNFFMMRGAPIQYVIGEGEWLFDLIMYACAQRMDVSWYFTLIMGGYIFFAMKGIRLLFKNNTYGAMLFFLGAFSFWGYATNGLRNGLACSVMILFFGMMLAKKRSLLVGCILAVISFSLHKSTALPIICFVATYIIKNPRIAIGWWFFSIVLYLVAHSAVESFFTSLGFDDRLSYYVNDAEEYAQQGFKVGFRFDFLIYSFMPILLGWYVTITKGLRDKIYNHLLNTYILSNSFWLMMMNASYSNRFAYLSWFMYPIVVAYPCLRMDVWGDRQGIMAGNILMIHTAFTVFMILIYY